MKIKGASASAFFSFSLEQFRFKSSEWVRISSPLCRKGRKTWWPKDVSVQAE